MPKCECVLGVMSHTVHTLLWQYKQCTQSRKLYLPTRCCYVLLCTTSPTSTYVQQLPVIHKQNCNPFWIQSVIKSNKSVLFVLIN